MFYYITLVFEVRSRVAHFDEYPYFKCIWVIRMLCKYFQLQNMERDDGLILLNEAADDQILNVNSVSPQCKQILLVTCNIGAIGVMYF